MQRFRRILLHIVAFITVPFWVFYLATFFFEDEIARSKHRLRKWKKQAKVRTIEVLRGVK